MKKLLLFISVTVSVLSACMAPPTATSKTKIRLPMGFIPNVQYAPYYVAAEKGYFAAENIEIEFDYKRETDGVKLVGAGELPFAVVSGEQVVLARSQGLPVKYVGQWYRKFPIAIFSLADKNIKTANDLKGKAVGLPGFFGATFVGWKAFANANGIKDNEVKLQEIGFTQAAAVQQGKVDAAVGYIVNEPVVLAKKGIAVNAIPVGVDMVANGIMTNEKTAKENPQLVRGLVKALIRGIKDTIQNPDEAMTITTKFVEGLKADDPIQREVLNATIELLKTDKLGVSDATAWENTQNTLLSMGQIKEKMDTSSFYTNEFVPSLQ
jgi:NitT/TauT family transport system substrate-binding protein